MSDCLFESEQCFLQSQIKIYVEIVANPFKNVVWLLADHKYNISLYHIRDLFALPFKQYSFPICHSPLYVDQKLFSFLDKTLSTARRTLLRENFSFGLAGATGLLHLHLHHTHVYVLNDLTFSLTCGTGFEISTFSSTAFALATINISLNSELALSTHVQLL